MLSCQWTCQRTYTIAKTIQNMNCSATSVQEKTVFIINNVSETDGGEYSLHIRREGKVDLHSEVKLIVKSLGG